MKIGLSYDLKEAIPVDSTRSDDALEEYDSPATIEAIKLALESQGHIAVKLGGSREFLANVLREKVDFIFNISEGRGNYRSREAQVPSVLEMLDIPYSGSDPQCLAVSLDKPLTKSLVAAAGVRTPKGLTITSDNQVNQIDWGQFTFPVIIKPACDGSSKGIRFSSLVENGEQATSTVPDLLDKYRQPILVEEFISGDEVTVGVVGNAPPKVLGIMRIVPRKKVSRFVYSLEVKRDWENLVEYECPAQLSKATLKKITESSLKAFEILGCRDFARIDFRVSSKGTPYFLEINPLAGLNPHSSDLPIMAGKLGLSYQSLISNILGAALARYPQCAQK